MGFYGPKKTHIKRIFGKHRLPDGTVVEVRYVYADVERTDSLPTVEWPGAQENQHNLLWLDAPGENGNPQRQMQIVRLTDPEDESDDPDTFIDIPTIDRMTMVRHPGAQEIVTTFQPSAADPVAEDLVTAREVAVRRVPFCETTVDDVLDATGYLADGEDYERKLETLDDTQHLDVEIVDSYPSKVYNGPSPQDVKVSLDNSALKDAYAKPPSDAKRPPLRLDPFQNIRNVCWGSGATEFEPGATIAQDCGLADTAKLSISMWVRMPIALSGLAPIMQFADGAQPSPPWDGSSGIYAGNGALAWFFKSRKDFDVHDIYGHYGSQPNPGETPPDYSHNFATTGDDLGWLQIQFINNQSDFLEGVWNHVGISVDLSSDIIHPVSQPYIANDFGVRARYDACYILNQIDQYNSGAEFMVNFIWNGSIVPVGGLFFADCPNFEINLSGQFGVPVQPLNASSAPGDGYPSSVNNFAAVELAAVQIWTDKFIDFRDPEVLAKFVAPAGDKPSADSVNGIRLVDPSVAQKEFGKPAFFFDGSPSKFAKNQGTGGEFTKIGDLKSFRPAPPRAPANS